MLYPFGPPTAMPYIRTARGTRSQFKPTHVARILSESFQARYAERVARYRADIQALTGEVIVLLENTLGTDPASEWREEQILQTIESVLRSSRFDDVHAMFLERHPRQKRPRNVRTRVPAFDPLSEPADSDPLWTVQTRKLAPGEIPDKAASDMLPGKRLGRNRKSTVVREERHHARRSEWLEWWRAEARTLGEPMDLLALEEQARQSGPALRSLQPGEWWTFWQPLLDGAMKKDPRLVSLLQRAQIRRARAALTGHSWLQGTPVLDGPASTARAPLMEDPDAHALYQLLWMEHIQRFNDPRLQRYNLPAMARLLRPERDFLLDWRGYQKLQSSEALRPIRPDVVWTSAPGFSSGEGAHEPPQWAWMRLAMVLSCLEDDPQGRAASLYDAYSSLTIIPSESLLRQAGRRSPRLIEDMAGRVLDSFEATQEAIYQSALNTKWTGTVSLDWARVRAQGSPIAGRRTSQGVASFVRAIDTNLATQGRPAFEKPVTVSLPIWHREIEDFLQQAENGKCVRMVITVTDLFMERVAANGRWSLMDPAFFPSLENHQEDGYAEAEAAMGTVLRAHPAAVRRVSASRLWGRILRQMAKTGEPFVLFSGPQKAFEPFPGQHPVQHGIDGVGALPLPPPDTSGEGGVGLPGAGQRDETYQEAMPWIMWPSGAVNLRDMISQDGTPDVARLRDMVMLAMRMLDNAFTLSEEEGRLASWASAHRSVCLGAVGFQEAIDRASAAASDDPTVVDAWVRSLAETWATAVISADQELKKERGAAPAWREPGARPYNPSGAMERLRARRSGALAVPFHTQTNWEEVARRIASGGGHRMSARTVWAPFQGAAAIAGVSPGGIGPFDPVEEVVDENGQVRWMPTPALLMLVRQEPGRLTEFARVLSNPTQMGRWPLVVRQKARPDLPAWRTLLRHAALIRPWVDQGVALTLPADLGESTLQSLIEQAWQSGVDCIRFEGGQAGSDEDNPTGEEKPGQEKGPENDQTGVDRDGIES